MLIEIFVSVAPQDQGLNLNIAQKIANVIEIANSLPIDKMLLARLQESAEGSAGFGPVYGCGGTLDHTRMRPVLSPTQSRSMDLEDKGFRARNS